MPLGGQASPAAPRFFFPSVASKKLGLSEREWLLSYTRRAVDTGSIKAEIQMRVNDLQKRVSRSSHKKVESDMETVAVTFILPKKVDCTVRVTINKNHDALTAT